MTVGKRVAIYLDLTQVHQQGIANGILRYARERGNWQLFGAYWPMSAIDDFRKWRGDGIVGDIQTQGDIELARAAGAPVVDTSGAFDHPLLSTVTNDNRRTGELAAAHFSENGHASFAFCGMEDMIWSDERLAGFAAGLEREPGNVPVFRKKLAWWHSSRFSAALGKWLARLPRPLAVFAANDIIGMNVVGACRLASLRIPEEVAVASVDNEEMLCELSSPPMSSFPFDRHEIGYRAAERLDALMRGSAFPIPPLRVQPLPLVIRASSSSLVFSDPLIGEVVSHIRRNAVNFLGVAEVARMFKLSRRNLERRFRAQIGHTMLEEIHRVRVAFAKRLLGSGDLPLVKVAHRCGFMTPVRFAIVFQKLEGVSPKAYRLNLERRR